jgi:hypothetical protein
LALSSSALVAVAVRVNRPAQHTTTNLITISP